MREIDVEEYKGLSLVMRRIVGAIVHGLRHVVLPEGNPIRIGIVLEYAETTVRHEFVPWKTEGGS